MNLISETEETELVRQALEARNRLMLPIPAIRWEQHCLL